MRKLRITTYKLRIIFFICLVSVFTNSTFGQGLPVANPQAVGMSAEKLNQIDGLVNQAIAAKKTPGAVVLVGRKGKIVYRKAFGNRSLVPTVEKMTIDTIFDVASLTKPVATATSIMILVEQGKIRLNDTVEEFIPELKGKDSGKVTIQQLLTHTSGYRPDFDLREKWTGNKGMLQALEREYLRNPMGTRFVYSDIGFIVLGEIVNRISGKTSYDSLQLNFVGFTQSNEFQPLNLQNSFFVRLEEVIDIDGKNVGTILVTGTGKGSLINRIAPTENIRGQQSYLGSSWSGDEKTGNKILRGMVHDPTSYRMHGVAGHAGLFSTADDLARYCQMLLNGGILDGKRIMSAATVAKMTKPYVISETGATRGLGFDMNTSFSSNRGELFPLGSFGHTGFTGTSIWIDPVSETFVVFLSNRLHPDGKGDVGELRAKVSTVVASAITDVSPEKIKEFEADYSAQVAAQLENFKQQIARKQIEGLPVNSKERLIPNNTMVLNGIDVLEKNNFKELNGFRVGLITNHTGRNFQGKPTIDVLNEAKNVKLVALFAPEHGIRGELDQEKINDSKDEKTGLPIYSLYGESRRPKVEHLKDLDAVVFDIQDIGTRFYTYISTLLYVMEEAAKAGKPVFVLDRTNPINGVDVEGAVGDADKLSFIAAHPLPVRHGMTVGELAQMFNAENKISADLRIVKMENWSRPMWFDQTNQIWTNPSPNMRSLTEATLYPGIGLLETTNLSVGRGTDTPFEVIGAPYIDGQKLAAYLNERNLKGVRFVPIRYTPKSSVFKDESVNGINIIITDRESFQPVRTGIEIAAALRKLYPNDWQVEKYARLLVNQEILEKIKRGDSPEEIEKAWAAKLSDFIKRREKFLIYK